MNAASATRINGPTAPGPKGIPAPRFSFVAGLIVFSVFCNVTGWALSALHQLNATGYAGAFSIGLAALAVWWRISGVNFSFVVPLLKLQKRFRRWLPRAFLLLSALAILGGVMYAPNNYDALAYRLPRVLHWLAEGHWHWIHTDFQRLNTRACGMEWIAAPLFAFTHSDRWLWVVNAVSLLLLPGLVFSVFTRLGVRRRVAWAWMWLLPTGYCYLLQAGGIGNDLFAAVFPLAALHFALRAKTFSGMALAVLGTAMCTGVKATNIPLCLPVVVALLPGWRVCVRRPVAVFFLIMVAAAASFLPMAWLNWRHCGDWSGNKAEQTEFMKGDRVLRTANNSVLLLLQNFCPPVFPLANQWNQAVLRHMPASLHERLLKHYESGGAEWSLADLQWEVNAGLGVGLCGLLLAGFAAGGLCAVKKIAAGADVQRRLVWAAIGIAILAYLANMGLSALGRLTAPYYFFMVAPFLLPSCQARAIRRWWWKGLALAVWLLALLTLVITPPRPLWPAETILAEVVKSGKANHAVKLAAETYTVNRARPDAFAPLRAALPEGEKVVGMITGDDPETSMWRPFGSRKIFHVLPADTGDELRRQGVRYIIVNPTSFEQRFGGTLADWLARVNGELVATLPLTLKASLGSRDWPIVALRSAAP